MDWRILLDPEVQTFMGDNAEADVVHLALKKPKNTSWPYALILNQIKTRQKARKKTPEFLKFSDFIFPCPDLFEQASSQACALYKASIAEGQVFIDLTAGCGVDSFYLAQKFQKAHLVEKDPIASEIIAHNLPVLDGSKFMNCEISVHNEDAASFLRNCDEVDLIYIDPQRRENNIKGKFDLRECSPDICFLLPTLAKKTKKVLIKTSPVLDIHQAIEGLGLVSEVHVVGWGGDCKEVLYCLDFDKKKNGLGEGAVVKAVELNETGEIRKVFEYRYDEERKKNATLGPLKKYIYEPGPAFMKAGGFASLAHDFGLLKLHQHSHLFTSDAEVADFPGNYYEVHEVFAASVKRLPVHQAELSIRNFPGKTENIRKTLGLKEGGQHRVFATTLQDESKKFILCKKIT